MERSAEGAVTLSRTRLHAFAPMADFRFVHAADIHLDSPLRGLDNYMGDGEDGRVSRVRDATRKALGNLVDLCIEKEADFLVISGDLYDGAWKSVETGYCFAREIGRLTERERPIPVYVIKGNHDAESVLTRKLKIKHLHVLGHEGPESMEVAGTSAVIHGQSFATRHVKEDLSRNYPKPRPGRFNIGLLHTSATGRPGHDPYAPCDPEDLKRKGYDYWALGHVHKREVLCEDPYILFPGNLQGRHIEEACDEGKGCTLVEVRNGRLAKATSHALDTVRWKRVTVDVTGARDLDRVNDLAAAKLREVAGSADGRLVACRLTLTGACEASAELVRRQFRFIEDLRALTLTLQSGELWLEKVTIRTTPGDELERALSGEGFEGALLQFVGRAMEDDALLEHVGTDALHLSSRILGKLDAGRPPLSGEELKGLVPQARQLLLSIVRGN